MEEADVVVAKSQDVAGKAAVDLLGAAIILEVLVVGKNIDDEFGAKQEVAPMFECVDDGEELAIPDRVILFGFGEGGGVVTLWVS